MDGKLLFVIALLATLGISALLLRILIPILKSHKMGQKILDIGPRWHKSKEGTPTMGGIAFYLASLLVGAAGIAYGIPSGLIKEPLPLLFTAAFALLNGVIGFLDDYTKFLKKQNEGLSAGQKYLLQLLVAGAYLAAMTLWGGLETTLHIPYLHLTVELGYAYYLLALILITGFVNSVNLADGIDGLCASETAVIGVFFAIVAMRAEDSASALLSALLIGACLGFLVYNWHPARIFMGDTGSLFLGGMVVGLAFLCDSPLILVICGFMYALEAISDILQVLWVKLFGKRLFLMAPIHHHFEKKGWSEVKVVTVFTLCTLVLCILAFFGIKR